MDKSQYKDAFVVEANELLHALNESLMSLEKEPGNQACVEEIFRAAHSLKGMAATMRFENMAGLTHHLENILDLVRQRRHPVTDELLEICFECLDALQGMVEAINAGEAERNAGDLIERLTIFGVREPQSPTAEGPDEKNFDHANRLYKVTVTLAKNCVLKSVRAYMVVKRLNHIGEVRKSNPSLKDIEDEKFGDWFELDFASSEPAEKIKSDVKAVSEVAGVKVQEMSTAAGPKVTSEIGKSISTSESQTVRISISHLDNLVNLVGELVINRSRLEKISEAIENLELNDVVQELRRLTSDLQYEVMQTRMVPVGNIFSRFPRMVRDAAKELGKKIDFVVDGNDIELDRTVLDEIGDPIVHLLRNAVGHGVESPRDRLISGKSETGTIKLSAAREKDAVIIEVSDDGGGLDRDKLKQKAIAMELYSAREIDSLREAELFALICRPGVTTADTTGTLSGRGVGMDAVKGKIEALGGTLQISSKAGLGTKFRLELPLTLAIIQALMVSAAGRTYALPLGNVVEVSAVDEQAIKQVKDERVMVVHDKIIPLVWLAEKMGSRPGSRAPERGCQVAVIRRGQELCGLVVEALIGRSEIVVKPLTKFFGAQPGIGGVTVLGDGQLVLVLDVRTLN